MENVSDCVLADVNREKTFHMDNNRTLFSSNNSKFTILDSRIKNNTFLNSNNRLPNIDSMQIDTFQKSIVVKPSNNNYKIDGNNQSVEVFVLGEKSNQQTKIIENLKRNIKAKSSLHNTTVSNTTLSPIKNILLSDQFKDAKFFGELKIEFVGTQLHFGETKEKQPVKLIRDYNNKLDKNIINIECIQDNNSALQNNDRVLGRLSKKLSLWLAPLIDTGIITFDAFIPKILFSRNGILPLVLRVYLLPSHSIVRCPQYIGNKLLREDLLNCWVHLCRALKINVKTIVPYIIASFSTPTVIENSYSNTTTTTTNNNINNLSDTNPLASIISYQNESNFSTTVVDATINQRNLAAIDSIKLSAFHPVTPNAKKQSHGDTPLEYSPPTKKFKLNNGYPSITNSPVRIFSATTSTDIKNTEANNVNNHPPPPIIPFMFNSTSTNSSSIFTSSTTTPVNITVSKNTNTTNSSPLDSSSSTLTSTSSDTNKLLSKIPPINNLEEMEQPKTLLLSLRPYQKQALAWMVNRENCDKKDSEKFKWREYITSGGIKYYYNTETKLSTFVAPRTEQREIKGGILADDMGLGKTIEMLALILTNIPSSTVNTYYKSHIDDKNRAFITVKSAPKTTLIVCPLAVLNQWRDEIHHHTPQNFLNIYLYHGANRKRDVKFLESYDIVITTYSTLAAEYSAEINNNNNLSHENNIHKISFVYPQNRTLKQTSTLGSVHWFRVVLDEAHIIKDHTTITAKAAFALNSERKWCLTGTPILNKLDDIYSLLHFLQIYKDYSDWHHQITKNTKIEDNSKTSLEKLQNLLRPILLRRTKEQCINDLPITPLPQCTIEISKHQLSNEEKALYQSLFQQSKSKFNTFVSNGTILKNYAHILELLLRLRQACNHPQLVLRNTDKETLSKLNEDFINKPLIERECEYCMEAMEDSVLTPCGHFFCSSCIEQVLTGITDNEYDTSNTNTCPVCEQPLSLDKLIPVGQENHLEDSKIAEKSLKTSTKITALVKALSDIKKNDPTIKSIVFSQWTTMLDLIESPLSSNNINYRRLDGTMSHVQRETYVNQFNKDPSISVFLISLKAGGLGLNLVSASHVYLLDPWWNPATEYQAISRVHRPGQTKPVKVVRFIMRDTIEERILELQTRKTQLAQDVFVKTGTKREELRKMRIDDLKLLFKD